uniref:S24 family peptidase n=1 Tax=Pannonibacter phragmitetus TaxID=121719 RepID=UPI000B974043|nr:S24 family peptidase [Pannonibacter phragmitetus]
MDETGEKRGEHPSLNAEVGRRIRQIVKDLGADRAEAASGKTYRSLERYFAGHDAPLSVVAGLAKAAGVTVDWILGAQELAAGPLETDNLVAVPMLPEAVSAGGGREASANDGGASDHVLFRREFLRSLSVNPQKAALLTVRGDSMEPTLSSGDLILADTGDQDIGTAGVFVISVDGSAMVKRLMRRGDGSVMVISDNQQLYPPETVAADRADLFRVIGRVRWYGRALR